MPVTEGNCTPGSAISATSSSEEGGGRWAVFEDDLLARGFTQIPNAVTRNPRISMAAKYMYGLLLSYAWQDPVCHPGMARMRGDTGAKDDTLRKYVRELQAAGLIDVRPRGRGRTNLYVFKRIPSSGESKTVGGIYLMHSAGVGYKIGVSQDVERRRKELARNLDSAVRVLRIIPHPNPEAGEELLQLRFTDKMVDDPSLGNEWFNLTDEDVSWFKSEAQHWLRNQETPQRGEPRNPPTGGTKKPPNGGHNKDAVNEDALDNAPQGANAPVENLAKHYTTLTVDRAREVEFDATWWQRQNWGQGFAGFVAVPEGQEPPTPARVMAVVNKIVESAADGYFLPVGKALERTGGKGRKEAGRKPADGPEDQESKARRRREGYEYLFGEAGGAPAEEPRPREEPEDASEEEPEGEDAGAEERAERVAWVRGHMERWRSEMDEPSYLLQVTKLKRSAERNGVKAADVELLDAEIRASLPAGRERDEEPGGELVALIPAEQRRGAVPPEVAAILRRRLAELAEEGGVAFERACAELRTSPWVSDADKEEIIARARDREDGARSA